MDHIFTNRSMLSNQRVARRDKGHAPLVVGGLIILLMSLTGWLCWPTSDEATAAPPPENLNADAAAALGVLGETVEHAPMESGPGEGTHAAAGPDDPRPAKDAPGETVPESQPESARAVEAAPLPESAVEQTVYGKVRAGESLSSSFARRGLDKTMAGNIAEAMRKKYDFRKLKANTRWEVKLNVLGKLDGFSLFEDPLTTWVVRLEGDAYESYEITGKTEMYVVPIAGVVEQSLAQSIWKLGEGDALTAMLAEIFQWDIDFFSDVRPGDEWSVLVEKYYYHDRFIRYGRILCAKFKGGLIGERYAYYFHSDDDKRAEYFDAEGNAVKKNFLRAPLDTTRVTSKYGFRMHPVQNKYKKHNGVDFGAPTGSPVWAVANGRVVKSGWMGSCGKGVKIRHNNGYESVYCHLSSINVNRGQVVKQKKLIGRVGCTGQCTGPHLHFGLKHNGAYVNPQSIKYTPGKKLEHKYLDRWKEARALLKSKLDAIELPRFYGPERPPGWTDPAATATVGSAKPAPAPKKKNTNSKHKRRHPRPQGIHAVQGG